MKTTLLVLFFLGFLLNSCTSSHCTKTSEITDNQINNYEIASKIAKEKYGNSFSLEENETKEYYLVINRQKSALDLRISFFIYDNETNGIILEDVIPIGSVKWIDRYKIEVQKMPGIVKKNDPDMNKSGYVFDVKTKQKIK